MTDSSSSESKKETHSGVEEEETSPKKTRSWWRHITVGRVLAGGAAAVIALAGVGYGHFTDPGPLTKSRNVVIPRGGTEQIAQRLQREGLLATGWSSEIFFRVSVMLTSRQGGLHAGELSFPARASVAHILNILRHGHPVSHSITIAEGITAQRIETILMKAPALQGEIPSFEEGSVYPQTIFYVWGTERQVLIHRLQMMMTNALNNVWAKRDQTALAGVIHTPQELLILASLIERETAIADERPKVARVFINRLQKNMRLQTDPTVIYALSQGEGTLDHPLMHDDLDVESPYNTYRHPGLPPGAICSPGESALEAAAHPAEGDALYFVATGHGGHAFAKTLSEHTEHVRAYRQRHDDGDEGP